MKLADKISRELIGYVRGTGYEIVIPNYYVGDYEMDVFRLMQSGYVVEYEIKISRSDFKADINKHHVQGKYSEIKTKNFKHDQLKNGLRICNRFFFVAPEGLIKEDEVPDHCGLIEYDNKFFNHIKNAPLLHKRKLGIEEYKNIALKLSFRESHLRNRLNYYRGECKTKDIKIENLINQINDTNRN